MVEAVVHPQQPPGLPAALESIPDLEVDLPSKPEGVMTALEEGTEALITFAWDDRWLDTSLKWVQAVSAGLEQFPREDLGKAQVRLTSARGVHAPTVAEHAIALLLSLTRSIGAATRDTSERAWRYHDSFELSDLTMGVLGLGAIGEQIAVLAQGLGMRVIGSKRDPDSYHGVVASVRGPSETLQVCQEADVVVAVLPNTPETEELLGRDELAAIGQGWFINVGRGSVADEEALVDLLSDGSLRGAGLDVFVTEPLPEDSPLWDMENVVMTPHSAWVSDRLAGRLAELIRKNVAAYQGEADWVNLVV